MAGHGAMAEARACEMSACIQSGDKNSPQVKIRRRYLIPVFSRPTRRFENTRNEPLIPHCLFHILATLRFKIMAFMASIFFTRTSRPRPIGRRPILRRPFLVLLVSAVVCITRHLQVLLALLLKEQDNQVSFLAEWPCWCSKVVLFSPIRAYCPIKPHAGPTRVRTRHDSPTALLALILTPSQVLSLGLTSR